MNQQQLRENYEKVQANIKEACLNVSRDPSEVTLVCVSKTKPIETLRDAIRAGMTVFGENKPQEIRDKTNVIEDKVSWHMIGKLQSNKIKYVLGSCDLIHSIDSLKLAVKLNEECLKRNMIMKILLQVNITNEESKSGFSVEELYENIETISKLKQIKVEGLMTIPPFVDDPETNRPVFKRLYEIFVDIKSKNIDNISMNALSMGMTEDYLVAIEEGATYVRVGTGIFGSRNYKK